MVVAARKKALKLVGGAGSVNPEQIEDAANWAGSDSAGDYDPERVYAKGGRGATEIVNFRLSQAEARFVNEFVGTRRHPEILTASDFYRDAIHHAIERWKIRMPEMDPYEQSTETIIVAAEALAAEAEAQARLVTAWTEAFAAVIKSGDRVLVLKTVTKARDSLPNMPKPVKPAVERMIAEARAWMAEQRRGLVVAATPTDVAPAVPTRA
jgi:hypothetical protein